MPKKYVIGKKRYLVLKKDEINIFEHGTTKIAMFTYPRWAWFMSYFDEIDVAVSKLMAAQEDVKLQQHIGGGWFVSVTSGFRCVDIRKFYTLPGVGQRPTKTGIALHLLEWIKLKDITKEIKEKHPDVAAAQPCWMQPDHFNQESAINCIECLPFGDWFVATSVVD